MGTMLKMGIVDDHLDFVCNHFKVCFNVVFVIGLATKGRGQGEEAGGGGRCLQIK